ncbi:hypothetical protein NL676_030904 [Syzygium grande]|nr:hypothetical protein NL676_030904 [Syzygium grande]
MPAPLRCVSPSTQPEPSLVDRTIGDDNKPRSEAHLQQDLVLDFKEVLNSSDADSMVRKLRAEFMRDCLFSRRSMRIEALNRLERRYSTRIGGWGCANTAGGSPAPAIVCAAHRSDHRPTATDIGTVNVVEAKFDFHTFNRSKQALLCFCKV